MLTLIHIFFQPRRAADKIKRKPRWIVVFLFLASLSLVIEYFMHDHGVQVMLNHLPSSASAQDKAAVVQAMNREEIARYAFLPIRLLAGWMLFSLILFYTCKIAVSQEPVRFLQVLSLEVHAEAALVGAKLAALIFMLLTPDGTHILPSVPLSVAALVLVNDFPIFVFLNMMNVFTFFYIGILAVGLSVICGFRIFKAAAIVLSVWGISALINIGILTALRETMHLNLL